MHESIGLLLKRNYYETDFYKAELSHDKVTFFFIPIYGLLQTLGFILYKKRYDYIEVQCFVQLQT